MKFDKEDKNQAQSQTIKINVVMQQAFKKQAQ